MLPRIGIGYLLWVFYAVNYGRLVVLFEAKPKIKNPIRIFSCGMVGRSTASLEGMLLEGYHPLELLVHRRTAERAF